MTNCCTQWDHCTITLVYSVVVSITHWRENDSTDITQTHEHPLKFTPYNSAWISLKKKHTHDDHVHSRFLRMSIHLFPCLCASVCACVYTFVGLINTIKAL